MVFACFSVLMLMLQLRQTEVSTARKICFHAVYSCVFYIYMLVVHPPESLKK